jgi:hypothetical protein
MLNLLTPLRYFALGRMINLPALSRIEVAGAAIGKRFKPAFP